MASKKVLVVFGATGGQGGSVVKAILGDPKAASEFAIRAVTRDASKPNAQALASKGVEVVTVSSMLPSLDMSNKRNWSDRRIHLLGRFRRQKLPTCCVEGSICCLCCHKLLGKDECRGGIPAGEEYCRCLQGILAASFTSPLQQIQNYLTLFRNRNLRFNIWYGVVC